MKHGVCVFFFVYRSRKEKLFKERRKKNMYCYNKKRSEEWTERRENIAIENAQMRPGENKQEIHSRSTSRKKKKKQKTKFDADYS